MRSRAASLLLVVVALLAAQRADAQGKIEPSAEQDAAATVEARELFLAGATLAKRGQWSEALAAFERSAALRAHPVTTYNLGYCERALGRSTRARKRFSEAIAEHHSRRGGEMPDAMLVQALTYLDEAEHRIARIVITLEGGAAPVAVDGRPLEPVASSGGVVLVAGTRDQGSTPEAPPTSAFELWADPGRHVLVVSRTAELARTFELIAGDNEGLRIAQPLADASRANPSAAASVAPARPAGPSPVGPILAFGVGVSGIVVGSVFGAMTLRKKSELDLVCGADGETCPPGSEGRQRELQAYAAASTVGFGVALAGAALGTFLLVWSRARGAPPPRRAWLMPAGAGVGGSFW
jgi:hypothetical protein